jgi:hypothetical protein
LYYKISMNSSIIINDIRKRSIRLQREQILDDIRREEEYYEAPLPKRIIIEAEERAKEKTNSHSWKKSLLLTLFIGLSFYLVFRFMIQNVSAPPPPKLKPKPLSATIAIQTDQAEVSSRVSFQVDEKLERLREEFKQDWKYFERDVRLPWLKSPISGPMFFDFYSPELKMAVDVLNNDMLEYPNTYHDTEEQFENFVYERKLKMDLCSEREIEYQELTIEPPEYNVSNR